MAKWLDDLREGLLRAGVAQRHVKRYLRELAEHRDDLEREAMRNGLCAREARALAEAQLGSVESLVQAMASRPQFQAWSVRAPWLVFGFGPLAALAAAYAVALTLLWTGWNLYLPYSMTPFVRISGVEIVWFGTGRLIYFTAPVLVGWGIALVAARQRLALRWPAAGLAALALIGGTAHVHVARLGAGWRDNRVSMSLNLQEFHTGLGNGHTLAFRLAAPGLLHVALLFGLAALPYAAWRWHKSVALAG